VRGAWREAEGGTAERMGRLSQVEVASERHHPLRKRVLTSVGCVIGMYAILLRTALHAQLQRWEDRSDEMIALAGPEASFLVPALFSFWYLIAFFFGTRSMAHILPKEAVVFEAMVLYNVLLAATNAFIVVSVVSQAFALQFRFVGNPAPVRGVDHTRLAIVAILHYHLRIFELLDTFFLVLRKKVGRSLTLHVMLRLQNVWGWHLACRYGCGGDIYFPVATNAFGSLLLHIHYALVLLEPSARKPWWPFNRLLLGPTLRRKLVTQVHVWVFRACLSHALLSFATGAYPRSVIAVQIVQMLFGIVSYSNFHHEAPEGKSDDWSLAEEPHTAKLVFSFDSSGWCFLYHFGVAIWIQEHFQDEITRGAFAFSGSSGGAIVAMGLATNVDMPGVVDSVLGKTWPRTRLKPWLLPAEIRTMLDRFCDKKAHEHATNRLRVLLTRIQSSPPFFMGEVACAFRSRNQLFDTLMASSHMPFIMGLGFPMNKGRYIDGLLWANAFVPWRSFSKSQRLCRVSAFSAIGADIGPRLHAIPPPWWPVFPPSQETLEGLMWAGYRDIAAVFGSGDGRRSGCGPCTRRQQSSTAGRLTGDSSERVDELIRIYECTAQRHWAMVIGAFVALTFMLTVLWLRFLAAS